MNQGINREQPAKENQRGQGAFDEVLNSATHGLGAVLSVFGLIVLLVVAYHTDPDPWKMVSFSVYGISLVLLFTASALYHGIREKRIKALLQKLDHSAIYILIAGTYTPFTLVALPGGWGWTFFGIIWGLALAGILFQVFFYKERYRILSTLLYVAMSCLIIFAIEPLISSVPAGALYWLLAGGVFYIGGVWFYIRKNKPLNHVVWHLFVLAGAGAHFLAIFIYLLPY